MPAVNSGRSRTRIILLLVSFSLLLLNAVFRPVPVHAYPAWPYCYGDYVSSASDTDTQEIGDAHLAFGDAGPGHYDVWDYRSVAAHEFGHTVRLKDVDYRVPSNDSILWPTMHWSYDLGSVYAASLSNHENFAVDKLYP